MLVLRKSFTDMHLFFVWSKYSRVSICILRTCWLVNSLLFVWSKYSMQSVIPWSPSASYTHAGWTGWGCYSVGWLTVYILPRISLQQTRNWTAAQLLLLTHSRRSWLSHNTLAAKNWGTHESKIKAVVTVGSGQPYADCGSFYNKNSRILLKAHGAHSTP